MLLQNLADTGFFDSTSLAAGLTADVVLEIIVRVQDDATVGAELIRRPGRLGSFRRDLRG